MVGGKKKSWFLKKRLMSKESWAWRFRFLWSSFRWKRLSTLPVSFMDDVVFKLVSAFEAIVLVLALCFFYLCCGCNF